MPPKVCINFAPGFMWMSFFWTDVFFPVEWQSREHINIFVDSALHGSVVQRWTIYLLPKSSGKNTVPPGLRGDVNGSALICSRNMNPFCMGRVYLSRHYLMDSNPQGKGNLAELMSAEDPIFWSLNSLNTCSEWIQTRVNYQGNSLARVWGWAVYISFLNLQW